MRLNSGRTYLVLALIALTFIAIGCGEKKTEETVTGPSINFVEGYDAALAAGKAKNQPVLIDFYTDWCRWCKVLDTVTYVDSSVIALSNSIVFGKVNAEADTVASKGNSVTGFPTLILFNNDGTEIDRIVGYLPPAEFVETINNSLNGIGTLDYYTALADSAPTPEVHYYLAGKYDDRGMYDEAEKYYQMVIKNNKDNEGEYTSKSMEALAGISMSLDNFDDAVARYKQLKEKFTDSAIVNDADIMIGIAYRAKKDTVMAIKAFEDFMKAHPNSPDTSYVLSQIERLKNPPPPEEK